MDAIVVTQIVIEPPIALIRAFLMDFFDLVSQALILLSSMAQFPTRPSVVGGTGHMERDLLKKLDEVERRDVSQR